MRAIVWGINYAPEFTGIAPHSVALCEFLHARGHDVEMVSTFSYYPTWRKLPEDEGRLYRTDLINGVPVHRCWHFVPERVSPLKRIIHEATFISTSFLRMLALPRPDVFVVVSPPLALGAAAWMMGAIKRAPFIFHVQDLQPDAALKLGMLQAGLVHACAALAGGICLRKGGPCLEHHARDARCVSLERRPRREAGLFPERDRIARCAAATAARFVPRAQRLRCG